MPQLHLLVVVLGILVEAAHIQVVPVATATLREQQLPVTVPLKLLVYRLARVLVDDVFGDLCNGVLEETKQSSVLHIIKFTQFMVMIGLQSNLGKVECVFISTMLCDI